MKSREELINKEKLNQKQASVVLDTSKELIVPAGAGSGKTKTLVTKIVELILSGYDLSDFLVLTFTNKAATEMKERVKKELNKNNLEHLAYKVDSANITTFDAFAYNFVKQNAMYADLDSNIELLDDTVYNFTKKKIMDDIILELMLQNCEKTSLFLETFTGKKDYQGLSSSLIMLHQKLVSNFGSIDSVRSPKIIISDAKLFDVDSMEDRIRNISEEFYNENIEQINEYFYYANYLNGIEPKKTFEKIKRFSYKTMLEANKENDKKKIADILANLKNLIKNDTMYEEIVSYKMEKEEFSLSILEILKKYESNIREFKKTTNKYEFNDISRFLNQILRENKNILERLKEQIKFVFVDEFQDTSKIQSDFLEMLLEDNENIKVMYVGDIKQSIYKFRNAKPETFIKKQKEANVITLEANYRSHEDIVNFVNELFERILDSEEKYDIDYKNGHHMDSCNTFYKKSSDSGVFLEELFKEEDEKKDDLEEIFAIGYKIKHLIETKTVKKYSDIAILSRDTKEFKRFLEVFKYLDIPLLVQTDEDINSSYFLKLIANILMFSYHIFDMEKNFDMMRFWYSSIARSELFKVNDFLIFESLIDINETHKTKIKLEIDPAIYDKALELNKAIKENSNLNIIRELLRIFNIYENIIYTNNSEIKEYQIDYLLKMAKSLSDFGINEKDFIKYVYSVAYESEKIKVKTTKDTSMNSVKITNIHQSKGLQYNTLFVCGLSKKFAHSNNQIKMSYSEVSGLSININTSEKFKAISKAFNDSLKQKELDSNIREELRILYVALTRAEERLYIYTFKSSDAKGLNSFSDYLYENDIYSLIPKIKQNVHIKKTSDVNYYKFLIKDTLYYPSKIDELEEVKYNKKDEPNQDVIKASIEVNTILDKKTKESLEFGSKIHLLFENTDFLKSKTDNKYLKQFLNQSFSNKNIKDAINIRKELPFSYLKNNIKVNGIIDLVIEYEDSVHIIDYKMSDIKKEGYQKQLKEYKDYIELVIPSKKVSTFLYSILKNEVKEVI